MNFKKHKQPGMWSWPFFTQPEPEPWSCYGSGEGSV